MCMLRRHRWPAKGISDACPLGRLMPLLLAPFLMLFGSTAWLRL